MLQGVVINLEKKVELLVTKVEHLECWSEHNNIHILGIPEKVEGSGPHSYMEKWITDNLKIPVLETAP